MTPQQIGKFWTTLSVVLTYYAINSWIVTQGGNEVFGTKLVVSGRVPAALIAIPVCTILLIVASLVGWAYARRSTKPHWHGRIPIVGFDDIETGKFEGRIYQASMLVLLVLVPVVSLVHFWLIVLRARIVTTQEPAQTVASIWDWSHFGWDDPARICSDFHPSPIACEHNSTVLPGFEPTVLALLTGISLVAVLLHLFAVFRGR